MTDQSKSASTKDVPTQVFEKFVEALREADLPDELVTRMQTTLIEKENLSEAALRTALFGEERVP
jgi:hypothetical protein